jgi:hypothetical protein
MYNSRMNLEMRGGDKKNLQASERIAVPVDLYIVAEDLHRDAFEKGAEWISQNPRGFILQPTITTEALASLGTLDFESSIMGYKDKLYFFTGSKMYAPNFENLRFHLHNHPVDLPGAFAVSPGDVEGSQTSGTEIDFIITRDGIIGYKPDLSAAFLTKEQKENPIKELVAALQLTFQNPNRTLRLQKEKGISSFYIPFRGDDESRTKMDLICNYMNNPAISWESIRATIEKE